MFHGPRCYTSSQEFDCGGGGYRFSGKSVKLDSDCTVVVNNCSFSYNRQQRSSAVSICVRERQEGKGRVNWSTTVYFQEGFAKSLAKVFQKSKDSFNETILCWSRIRTPIAISLRIQERPNSQNIRKCLIYHVPRWQRTAVD